MVLIRGPHNPAPESLAPWTRDRLDQILASSRLSRLKPYDRFGHVNRDRLVDTVVVSRISISGPFRGYSAHHHGG